MARRDEILREFGVAPLWRRRAGGVEPMATRAIAVDEAPDEAPGTPSPSTPMVPLRPAGPEVAERRERIATLAWDDLAADIDACNACGLCRTRNRSVPGVGDPHARWLFVGEAPGAEEDARGEPFVGQAGRLLDNMLSALGMTRAAAASTSPTSSSAGPRAIARRSPRRPRPAAPISSGRSR